MWFDTSIKFKGNNTLEVLQRLARQRSGFTFFVGITGHSIIAATHPGMMEYIPIKTNDSVNDMFKANSMIVINTPEVQKTHREMAHNLRARRRLHRARRCKTIPGL